MLSRSSRVCPAVSTVVLPRFTTCFGPCTECAGVYGHDLAGDEPIEQHADRREVLLDRRLRHRFLQAFDVGRDVQRLDSRQLADTPPVAPDEKQFHGAVISGPRILIPDRRGEKFEEAPSGRVAGIGDDPRHQEAAARGNDPSPPLRNDDLPTHGISVS
jgi:hypothetical protein